MTICWWKPNFWIDNGMEFGDSTFSSHHLEDPARGDCVREVRAIPTFGYPIKAHWFVTCPLRHQHGPSYSFATGTQYAQSRRTGPPSCWPDKYQRQRVLLRRCHMSREIGVCKVFPPLSHIFKEIKSVVF